MISAWDLGLEPEDPADDTAALSSEDFPDGGASEPDRWMPWRTCSSC